MRKLKGGDRVKYLTPNFTITQGAKGTVVRTAFEGTSVHVEWDTRHGMHDVWTVCNNELVRLRKKKKHMCRKDIIKALRKLLKAATE